METDRNLLFGVLALQAGLIDREQFVDACIRWSQTTDRSLPELLVEPAWMGLAEVAQVDRLVESKLHPKGDDNPTLDTRNVLRPDPRSIAGTAATPSPPAVLNLGASVSGFDQRYVRERVHATGGMGQVWLAHDTQLNRHVALKELRPEVAGDAPLTSRFIQEARITGRLEHPGIVPVYEFAWNPDTHHPFYTMRFVRGRTLVEACREFHQKRRTALPESLELVSLLNAFVAVCNTIAYAHSHRILHRDLKGENVLLGDFGEVVVLDWGLAKSLDAPAHDSAEPESVLPIDLSAAVNQTVQGDVMGTPGYMAPEQAAGQVDLIDQRTDVYGLGAILYEILTGQPPNPGATTLEMLNNAQSGEVVPPRDLWPEVPLALEAACLRALAKNPAFRFASGGDLGQEVQLWQDVQRRQAEAALQRQTEILQSILNSMGEGVLVADDAGNLLEINPAAERFIGPHPPGTKLGESPTGYELYLSDQVTPCSHEQRPLMQAIRGGEVDDAELFVRVPGKTEGLWVSACARPLKDKRGAVQGGLVVIRDISERKRAEEELRRSRERFDLAVQGSQDGLWDWDLESNDIYYSPRWKSIIGYAEHEIAARLEEWSARLHPEERERVLAANYAHIAGSTPHYEYEYRLRHKDGSYRWILARGVALRDATGKAYRMAGSHVDVTSRREAEQAWKESEARYDAVFAVLQVGVTVMGPDGQLFASNSSAQNILGLSAQQLRQRSVFDSDWQAIHEDGSPFPAESFPAVITLRTGKPCQKVVMGLPKPEGGVRWISINSQPMFRDEEVTPYAVITSFQCITEHKSVERALKETRAALTRRQQELQPSATTSASNEDP